MASMSFYYPEAFLSEGGAGQASVPDRNWIPPTLRADIRRPVNRIF